MLTRGPTLLLYRLRAGAVDPYCAKPEPTIETRLLLAIWLRVISSACAAARIQVARAEERERGRFGDG
jgi:hypothetical protein